MTPFETKEYPEKKGKGLKRDKLKHAALKSALPQFRVFAGATIPGKFNLAPKVSPPEDQGQCGSCWDFAITKALRSAHMIAGKDPGRLAFNYLLNNCSGVPAAAYDGCNGGDFQAGLGMLDGRGPWLESQDPYTANEGVCKMLPVAATAKQWVMVGDGRNPPTFQELASALAAGHMMAIDVAAGAGSWENYSGGIYDHDAGNSVDHMINLVGYDMETSVDKDGNAQFGADGKPVNGDGYLIVMNNWGTNWGEHGYMRTRWGMNAVADTAMFFTVDAAPVPPPAPEPVPVPPAPAPEIPTDVWKWIAIGMGAVIIVAGAIYLGTQVAKKE